MYSSGNARPDPLGQAIVICGWEKRKREGRIVKKMLLVQGVLAVCALTILGGCATGGGMSPEEQAQQTVESFKAALLAQDMDALMAAFSEEFEHYEWGDKEGAADFLGQANDMGYLEDLEVVLDEAETEIEGDTATVYPIDLEGAFGAVTIELVLTKEADGWLITGLDASGV